MPYYAPPTGYEMYGQQQQQPYYGGAMGYGGYQQMPQYGQQNYYGGGGSGGYGSKPKTKQDMRKYKTMLCRHFEQQGTCTLGDNCSFAHGQEQLRTFGDPLPPEIEAKIQTQSSYGSQPMPYVGGAQHSSGGYGGFHNKSNNSGNFKTAICKNFANTGNCRYGDSCTFAHGDQELKKSRSNENTNSGSYYNH